VEYIQYELLKSFIKSRPSDQQWSSDDEADFIQLFSNEYNKVKLFISSYISQLEGRIQHCRQLLDHSQRHPSHCSDQGFCNSIDDSLIEIIFDINDFSRFIHINHVGFEKTLSKCKKWTNIHGVKGYQHLIGSLDHQRTYLLYAKVSKLRYQCRAIPVATPKVISTPELHPPQTSSKKYWIHPEHLSEVTAILCVHMFIVFDTEMSNFYLDNEAMEGYFDRKNRKDNACTIKCKRYFFFF
jgi:SPX domain protein involved in polyphosphate accumulation